MLRVRIELGFVSLKFPATFHQDFSSIHAASRIMTFPTRPMLRHRKCLPSSLEVEGAKDRENDHFSSNSTCL